MTLGMVLLGAAVGAPCRYLLSRRLNRLRGFPWGTLAVNLLGSFVLGVVSGLAVDQDLGVGGTFTVSFCGGFTTYSAFAVETAELGRLRGLVYAATSVLGCVAAAALGWRLA